MSILIADDHPFTLQGTKTFVTSLGYTVSHICSNGITALNLIIAHSPEIAILDINMPGMDGIEVLEKIHAEKIHVKIVLLTMHNERSIYNRAYELGGYGYLLKNFADTELELCLEEVRIGRKYVSEHINKELVFKADDNNDETNVLTLTEKKILQLIGEQKTSKQIGQLLFIAEKTVEGHRRNIVNKLKLPKEKNILLHYAAKIK